MASPLYFHTLTAKTQRKQLHLMQFRNRPTKSVCKIKPNRVCVQSNANKNKYCVEIRSESNIDLSYFKMHNMVATWAFFSLFVVLVDTWHFHWISSFWAIKHPLGMRHAIMYIRLIFALESKRIYKLIEMQYWLLLNKFTENQLRSNEMLPIRQTKQKIPRLVWEVYAVIEYLHISLRGAWDCQRMRDNIKQFQSQI